MAKKTKINQMTLMAIFTAIVVVLQIISYLVKIGTFNLSLVLIPIVVAGVLMGPKESAFLGGVFGVVVLLACVFGLDAGGAILWNANPLLTAIVCIVKGVAAGFVSGLCFKALRKVNGFAATVVAAVACPVVNTGIFCVFMATVFREILAEWAGGSDVLTYMIVGLVGINFVIEFIINLIFSPAISQIMKAVGYQRQEN